MKTDALIAMLARGPVEADTGLTTRRLSTATAAGFAGALAAMLVVLGPRPDLAAALALPMFWLKLALPLALAAALFAASSRLARPGGRAGSAWVGVAALLLALWALAIADLALAPAAERRSMVEGTSAWSCIASIALLSLPLLVAGFVALRGLAPTSPRAAGLAAGALAGSLAAAVYAWHCTEMTVPFLALWYVAGMALPAVVGMLAGPRLLRWA